MLSRLVDTRFQVLFTPLAGVLFAFPSRYWFTIGRQVVLSLGRWSSQILTGFLGPRHTQVPSTRPDTFRLRGYHPLWLHFPEDSSTRWFGNSPALNRDGPTTPSAEADGLGWPPFARHYLGGLYLIFFPAGTEMFHFPALASAGLCIQPADTC